jgi:hypothetical protein
VSDNELLDGNDYDSEDLGYINSVKLGAWGYREGLLPCDLTPIFNGVTTGDDYPVYLPLGDPGDADWNWVDITYDSEAPVGFLWSWTDIGNLDCDVTAYRGIETTNMPPFNKIYCGRVWIKVCYY